jgi:hypothetical protein
MTQINTIEDLIRLLDENPQWAEALRVRLLTRELIELPEKFAKFAEVTDQRLSRLETDVGQLKTDVGQLKTDVGQLQTNVGHLQGWALESRLYSRIVPLVCQRLGVRRAEIMRSPVQEMRAGLRYPVEDSADSNLISDSEEQRVVATDYILRARRRGVSEPVWVAVEVSNKVHSADISRALETAHVLTVVFDEESIPVVAGYAIDPPDQQQADQSGVVYMEVNQDWP